MKSYSCAKKGSSGELPDQSALPSKNPGARISIATLEKRCRNSIDAVSIRVWRRIAAPDRFGRRKKLSNREPSPCSRSADPVMRNHLLSAAHAWKPSRSYRFCNQFPHFQGQARGEGGGGRDSGTHRPNWRIGTVAQEIFYKGRFA
jgi:hypothetical protein